MSDGAPAGRSGLRRAVVLLAVSGGGLLATTSGAWARAVRQRPAPLPADHLVLSAGDLVPGARALGLVLLAAAAALLAVRGWGRTVLGVGVLVAAGAAVFLCGRAALSPASLAPAGSGDVAATARPVIALVVAAVGLLPGLLVTLRGHSWPALGRRYEVPSARARDEPEAPVSEPGSAVGVATSAAPAPGPDGGPDAAVGGEVDGARAWEALDRGEDPTRR